MAFVIVSAGHLTDSRLRTLRARPVVAATAGLIALLMLACLGAGYGLGQRAGSASLVGETASERPDVRALVNRVGELAGRLARLESEARTLASRLGVGPTTAALAASAPEASTGGPMVPAAGIADLEFDLTRLEETLAGLSDAATERDVESMAFPNRLPVAGSSVPISSQFGVRHDPFTGRLARHTGLDIPAAYGTPILASGGGRVVSAGYKGAYGRTVVIDHGDGLATLYGHASRLLVRVGDVVMPQQKIALVGSTGRSTGPHLHFEVIRAGRRVEPREYLAHVLDRKSGALPQ